MARLTRIRLEAEGHTASDVDFALRRAAEVMEDMLFLDASPGECVIQREQGEPNGAETSYSGRLILHPNVAEDARQRGLVDPKQIMGDALEYVQLTGSGGGGPGTGARILRTSGLNVT